MKQLAKIAIFTLCIISGDMTYADERKRGDMAADIGTVGIPVIAGSIALLKNDYDGFWMFAQGATYTLVATQALKYSVRAERPNGEDNLSFPSGHTSSAFQGASFLQFRYGWQYGVPAYIGAGLVGYSRVRNDHHYWRDVIAGALLATSIQYLVTDKYLELHQVAITPIINSKQFGITASFSF